MKRFYRRFSLSLSNLVAKNAFSIPYFRRLARKCLEILFATFHPRQVKRTPEDSINEFIIRKFNPVTVADFRLIFALILHA